MRKVVITLTEEKLLKALAEKERKSIREVVSEAIFFLAHKVDYTQGLNIKRCI
ncbi:MAG: hypothetical protein IKF72_12470 [Kiritimatiellae bacterium]|nr:hypothetical protein [Kiritimatiellia bacterium]